MNIRHEPNVDSLYKPIERRERVFRPLQIPTQLQQDLPFHLKPKPAEALKVKDPIEEKQRVAVVLEPQEKKVQRQNLPPQMIKFILSDQRYHENVYYSL